jgi:hypothetical protein
MPKNRVPAGLKSTPAKKRMESYYDKYPRSLRSRSFSIHGRSIEEKQQQIEQLESLAVEAGFESENDGANLSGFINWIASGGKIVERYGNKELVVKIK